MKQKAVCVLKYDSITHDTTNDVSMNGIYMESTSFL